MAKISIDLALTSFSNFQAYEGNPPASEADYNNLKPFKKIYNDVYYYLIIISLIILYYLFHFFI